MTHTTQTQTQAVAETQLYDCRDAFENKLRELASQDQRIVAVVNDSVGSSKLNQFGQMFPIRLVNVGIAEQNMVGVGAGLANGGLIPFVTGAAPFLTGRALEQIKADLAYSNQNVKLCGISSGMAYGELGPTHHSIEDVAWLRAIANMTIIVPADPIETAQAVEVAARTYGPMFIRISRLPVPIIHDEDYRFEIGKAALLREGRDVTLIAMGVLVTRALDAADMLAKEGVKARVLNMSTVRPLDKEAVLAAAAETGAIVTAEEHTVFGGLGSAVAEVVVANRPVPMRILGVPGVFAPTGSASWLLEHFALTAQGIFDAALELVGARV
jgi:transketolase